MNEVMNKQEAAGTLDNLAKSFIADFCETHPATVKTIGYGLGGLVLIFGAIMSAQGIPAEF